ncbi:MAG: pyrroline-5-carboxylate reductase [Candidatus Lumbricidophila eiseniae]|uniref:Pyrroline-5-carboxylate reductase n=1 Tax=Candidatus Lumbricidiphila eiseniae TaxID=1969409 RepID=A0A2A6FRB9_9MICO|nr:MAG: pyrroline-5-carboxylate reductase [Candidatus Lumbricidophila eiseniae]
MNRVTLPPTAFLGAGSMARAIIAGLQASDVAVVGGIRTTNRSAERAAELASSRVTAYATETDAEANRRAVRGAGLVIIAVKPAMVPDLLLEIADALDPHAVVVSVAAGVTTARCEELLPVSVAVIRAMPNTPALVRRAVTGISVGSRASATDLALAVTLFEAVGEVLVVPEGQIDALSAISGSGPAYVFYLIEQVTTAARTQGFTDAEAKTLVEETFRGASELLAASSEDPAELRRRVTSPNGTTERAIAVLTAANLAQVFERATDAALARAYELATGV